MTQTTPVNDHPEPIQLSAFIDGELSPSELQAIQRHLTECHPCALQVLSAAQLKAVTARASQRFLPPPEVLKRLASQLVPQETTKPARAWSFGHWAWSAIAAVLAIAVSSIVWWQMRQANNLTAELLDQHLAVLSSGASPEIISTDRHTVKPWFQGKLPFSFNLPETLPPDTTLRGGDLTFLRGQPAALLLFTIHRHEVSVILTQRSGNPAITGMPVNSSGFSIKEASTRNLRIFAVSDIDPTELGSLAAALQAVQSTQ